MSKLKVDIKRKIIHTALHKQTRQGKARQGKTRQDNAKYVNKTPKYLHKNERKIYDKYLLKMKKKTNGIRNNSRYFH